MKNFSNILSVVAVVLAAAALIVSVCTRCCNKKAVAAAEVAAPQIDLAKMLAENPKMVADAMQAYEIQRREEEQKALQQRYVSFQNEINDESYAPFVGPKDAKITVTEFYDFSCGFCKRMAPAIEKIVADNPDVKVVFKPLTFVAGAVSVYQAKAGFAAYKQGKFVEFYKAVMGAQGRMNEAAVDDVAKSLNLDMSKFKADMDSPAAQEYLSKVQDVANKIGLNGVPMVFVNAKHIQTLDPEPIQSAIDALK